jgi:hypothetical protein
MTVTDPDDSGIDASAGISSGYVVDRDVLALQVH